jgi:hypothetical protein
MRDNIRQRRYGFILLGTALTFTGLAAVTTPAGASSPASIRPGTLLPASARLNSVYCTTSTNCWAVGIKESAKSAQLNQIARWDGKKWTAVSAPSPGGTKMNDVSQLFAVRCTSAANCWAVGRYQDAAFALTQALHWNGRKWALVPTPSPGGTAEGDFADLFDVACTSASSCWAAGDYGNVGLNSGTTHNLAIHWNGKKWSKVTTPNPAGTSQNDINSLNAVRCASSKDCWAAGSAGISASVSVSLNEMLHWNGKRWSEASVPSPAGFMIGAYNTISGLSCTSASNCWAVGTYGGGSVSLTEYLNEALHWNGHKWSQVTTPNPDGTASGDSNSLVGVNCSAASNCWAVGNLGGISSGGATTSEALHWKGTKWSLTKTPNPGGVASGDQTELSSVRCVSAKDCWAVGFSRSDPNPDLNVTLHWNSVKWTAR